jgi:hypothetical protein
MMQLDTACLIIAMLARRQRPVVTGGRSVGLLSGPCVQPAVRDGPAAKPAAVRAIEFVLDRPVRDDQRPDHKAGLAKASKVMLDVSLQPALAQLIKAEGHG